MGNLLLAKSRINILVIGIFVLFTLLACQLFRVQVVQASNYQRKAANEMQSTRCLLYTSDAADEVD
jgi:cell division protein FtsI (penicillin-binding protein 3)